MSGDTKSVQCQMITNEFVNTLKSLSISTSSNESIGKDLILLTKQFQEATPNGFGANKLFAFAVIENLYRVLPVFERILSDTNPDNQDAIEINKFLTVLYSSFNTICMLDVLTLLKETAKIQKMFDNYIGLVKERMFNNVDRYEHILNCLIPIIGFSSVFIPINENQLPSNFLPMLLTYVKQYWYEQSHENSVLNVLRLMKSLSKKRTLVPMIIESKWPHACIEWLDNRTEQATYVIDYHVCLILQKLARHNLAVPVLKDLHILQALSQGQRNYTELQMKCLNLLQCMIYALLMESNEIKEKSLLNDHRMCQALDKLVLLTIEASKNELLCYECFHVSEILSVLCKLFINDDILFKCLNETEQLFECLSQLTTHFSTIILDMSRTHLPLDDETIVILMNVLWSISFHEKYQDKFRNNSLLMHSLSNLAASSTLYTSSSTKCIPRDMSSLKKAAEGIIWNLKSSSGLLTKVSNDKSTQQEQPMVMISYSHSDSMFCRQLVDSLSAYVPVWVDYKQAQDTIAHSDDLWEEIARAMEMATVIVLIVSKEYYDSKSCRQELSYVSDTLKKRIIPIYPPNQQYRASGWLGIRIAGQKYVHFGRKLFPDAVKELAGMMMVSDQKPVIVAPTEPIPVITYEKTVEHEPMPMKIIENKERRIDDWNEADIRKWMSENFIHENLIDILLGQIRTGSALIIYARHMKLFYRLEYLKIYSKYYAKFHGKIMDTLDFITFVDALYRLRREQDPNSFNEDNYEVYHQNQLPTKLKACEEKVTWL